MRESLEFKPGHKLAHEGAEQQAIENEPVIGEQELFEIKAACEKEQQEILGEAEQLSQLIENVDQDALDPVAKSAFAKLKEGFGSFIEIVKNFTEKHPQIVAGATLAASIAAFAASYELMKSQGIFVPNPEGMGIFSNDKFSPSDSFSSIESGTLIFTFVSSLLSGYASAVSLLSHLDK